MPVQATIDLAALRHNVRVLQDRAGEADLMAVVKADAYGHGAQRVTKVLSEEGIRHFAVARASEGIRLRDHGLADRILVLGAPSLDRLAVYSRHDLELTVSSAETANAVLREARPGAPLRVHLKIDTGMGRLGVSPEDAAPLITQLSDASGVELVGVWTHFATADDPQSAFAQTQLDRFNAVLADLDASIEHVHAANTGALLTLDTPVHARWRPLIRTGIGLYGLAATPELSARIDLHPVMELSAKVMQLKTVDAGTPISYGARWTASRTSRIATLGIGYGDGYPRLCSGRASVRIDGVLCPIVGTICMDMCMVDLGPPDQVPATTVTLGTEATLFSGSDPTVFDVARWAETIPYEICCGISPRVPRHYVDTEHTEARPSSVQKSSAQPPDY